MTETKHTPGPWTVSKSGVSVDAGPTGPRIRQERGAPDEELRANASLIAAAPDLLAAVKALLIVAEHGECEAMHPDEADHMARAAIAKAEGRS